MATTPTIGFHVSDNGGSEAVVSLQGRLDRANVEQVAEVFGSVFLVGYREVVVDIAALTLTAAGARLLAAFSQMLADADGRLRIRSASPEATRLLRTADLGHLVTS